MTKKRKFPRIRFDARCIVLYEDYAHEGKMVNISLCGAMISLNDSAIIPLEEKCLLKIFAGSNETPYEIEASVVYPAFSCIGVRFLAFDEYSHPQLHSQIELLSRNPEKYRVAYP
jgi:PilZ domain